MRGCWKRSDGPLGRDTRLKGEKRRGLAHPARHRASALLDGGWGSLAPSTRQRDQVTDQGVLRNELALELSESKTPITHATSQAARSLGYEVRPQHADHKLDRLRLRAVNAAIRLFVPKRVIRPRRPLHERGKRAPGGALLHDGFTIGAKYEAEYRGLVQCYLVAQNVFRLSTLHWIIGISLLKTLAGTHRSTVMKMARTYKATSGTPERPRACLKVAVERDGGRKPLVARFDGIPLRWQCTAVVTDLSPVMARVRRNELMYRLRTEGCDVCEAQARLDVHHVRKLADLNQQGRHGTGAQHPGLGHAQSRPEAAGGPSATDCPPLTPGSTCAAPQTAVLGQVLETLEAAGVPGCAQFTAAPAAARLGLLPPGGSAAGAAERARDGRVERTSPVCRSALCSPFLSPFGIESVTVFDRAPL
jgi:Type II intron maturase